MKKLMLALAFLAVVVAVSYYRAVTHKQQESAAYELGRTESAHQVSELDKQFNSLMDSTKRQQLEAVDSLWQRELAYQGALDSLNRVLDRKGSEIASLRAELEQVRSRIPSSKTDKRAKKQKASRHEQILSYYKKRYRSLPKDLSPYEKRVALAEIRDETAQKFTISLQELDKIRKYNKLDY